MNILKVISILTTFLFTISLCSQTTAEVEGEIIVTGVGSTRSNVIFKNASSTLGNLGEWNEGLELISEKGLELIANQGAISFLTYFGAGIDYRMFIDESGEVGINTESPTELLDVANGVNSITLDGQNLEWKISGDTHAKFTNQLGTTVISNELAPLTGQTSPKFQLRNLTETGGGTPTMRTQIRVDYDGDVGIGRDISSGVPSTIFLQHNFAENAITGAFQNPSAEGVRIQNNSLADKFFTFYVSGLGNGNLHLFSTASPNVSIGNFDGMSGSYSATSDVRKKSNIVPMAGVLDDVLALTPSSYNFKTQTDLSKRYLGIMAQELNEKFPEVVSYNEGADQYSVDYSSLSTVAIKAIQEQQELIIELQDKLSKQQAELERILEKMER